MLLCFLLLPLLLLLCIIRNTGDRYEGEWKEGRKEGKGVFYFAKSGNKYEGSYNNDARNGHGKREGDIDIDKYINRDKYIDRDKYI